MNLQPTKDLQQFQKLIVQDMYIKKLNQWLDEMEWENEKKDALVEMLEKEIDGLKRSVQTEIERKNKTQTVKIEGWGYKFDGKQFKIEHIKYGDICESGFLVKINGYENYLDSNWITVI